MSISETPSPAAPPEQNTYSLKGKEIPSFTTYMFCPLTLCLPGSPLTGFIDAVDHAVADNEVITTLFVETQLRAFFHRASFAANQHQDSPFASAT